jgi:hypothetical protein
VCINLHKLSCRSVHIRTTTHFTCLLTIEDFSLVCHCRSAVFDSIFVDVSHRATYFSNVFANYRYEHFDRYRSSPVDSRRRATMPTASDVDFLSVFDIRSSIARRNERLIPTIDSFRHERNEPDWRFSIELCVRALIEIVDSCVRNVLEHWPIAFLIVRDVDASRRAMNTSLNNEPCVRCWQRYDRIDLRKSSQSIRLTNVPNLVHDSNRNLLDDVYD